MFLFLRSLPLLLVVVSVASAEVSPARDTPETNSPLLVGVQSGIEYRSGLTLDAYAPPGTHLPAALVIHGSSGSRSTHVNQLFPLLARAGFAWFSPDYQTVSDLRSAVSFINQRYTAQGRILLIGEDSGVALALQLAAQGGFESVIGFGSSKAVAGMPDPRIPVVLFHGTDDTDSNPAPIESACRTWAKCRFASIPHGIHNLENWHPAEWEWKEEFVATLRNGRKGLWPEIVYARPGGLPLTMDAHLPASSTPRPAVIVVHGGGWEAGDKSTYVSPVLSLLSGTDMAWFSIDYRLTPYVRNAEQLEDVRNAIRYVRAHARRFGIDPNAIAILGESAGGQLVAQVASEACSGCDVQAVVSFYGVYDFVPWAKDPESKPMLDRVFGPWDLPLLSRYSPLAHVHPGMPPLLLLQGTADELYPGTLAYEKQLKASGVPHEMILLPNAPHGMENWVLHPEWQFYQPKLVSWLRSTLHANRAR